MRILTLAIVLCSLTSAATAQIALTGPMLGGLRARPIGPAVTSGRVTDINVVDSDPHIIWVGSASGGVWKSTNGGTTFKPVFDEYPQSIGAVEIDQARPDTVWVGTGEIWTRNSVSVGDGIFRTTDAGKTWKKLGLERTERIAGIRIDPKDPATVYVAALGALFNDSEDRGVYKTTDAGQTWTKVLYVNASTGAADIVMDPSDPKTLYCAMWTFRRMPYSFVSGGEGSSIYKTTDGGATWKPIMNGMPPGPLGRSAIDISRKDPKTLYATVEAKDAGFYRTTDGGASWHLRSGASAATFRPFYFARLVVDPSNDSIFFKTAFNLSVSVDAGATLESRGGAAHGDFHDVWIDPKDGKHVLVATDGGVYASWDQGKTFRFLSNLPLAQFYHVSVDNARPYNVYGGLQDNGSWSAPSASPGGIQNGDWENLGFGDGFHVVVDPKDPQIVYWEYQGGKSYRQNRATRELAYIRPEATDDKQELRFNWNTPLHIGASSGALYTGSQFVHRSTDRGASWTVISPDLTTNDPKKLKQEESGGIITDNTSAENHCTVFTIAESPKDANVIWAGTDDGNLQVTRDGGRTWTKVSSMVPNVNISKMWCTHVEPSPHDAATAFATFDGHWYGDRAPHVARTTDYGATWKDITTNEISEYAHVIRQDPVAKDLLYLGTENGLYISLDGGAHWAPFRSNMPPVAVRDIVVHPRDHDLVIATHGRGIYIIDDITPLRNIDPSKMSGDILMLPSKPALLTFDFGLQDFPGDGDFNGENPSSDAQIAYFARERHMRGKMTLVVKNERGDVITTLSPSPRKGLNRVAWPLRIKAPLTAKSEVGVAGSSMTGPYVEPGRYVVELTKDTVVHRGEVLVEEDPSLPHSKADRAAQRALTMKLYRLQEDLAVTGYRAIDIRDSARTIAAALGTAHAEYAALSAIADSLEAINNTLANTKYGMVTGEEQLREKVSDLYGSVNGYAGRPSATHERQAEDYRRRVEQATQRVEATLATVPGLNARLTAQGAPTLPVETREQTYSRLQAQR